MSDLFPISSELVELARKLGHHPARIALWDEGAVAAHLVPGRIIVSTAGASLAHLDAEDFLEVDLEKARELIGDEEAENDTLGATVISPEGEGKPSRDAFIFAELFALEGVRFVAHTQPVAINQILCSPRARQFADRRHLPHEVLVGGQASVLVPFAPPGLPLAREVKRRIGLWQDRYKAIPRIILIQNHGMIALGSSVEEVLMRTEMTVKFAEIFLGASMLGGPEFLKPTIVTQIDADGVQ